MTGRPLALEEALLAGVHRGGYNVVVLVARLSVCCGKKEWEPGISAWKALLVITIAFF
jgi:hypothetical protein